MTLIAQRILLLIKSIFATMNSVKKLILEGSQMAPNGSKTKESYVLPPPEVGRWLSYRYLIVYLGYLGLVISFILRYNPSVAVLSMVGSTPLNGSVIHLEGLTKEVLYERLNKTTPGKKYNWSKQQQAAVISQAYFIGCTITVIPGGYLADRFGAKWLYGGSILFNSISNLFIPFLADLTITLVIAIRFLQGLAEGPLFPCVHNMIGRWVPSC